MIKVAPAQLDSVLHRRTQLRNQRRLKLVQAGCRTLAIAGLTGGLVWAVSLPDWEIRQPEQVSVEGSQLLSTAAIRSLLPLSLPQSLIHLQPEQMTSVLKSNAPIDNVTITRQLFPPKVIVSVQERKPVAVVPCDGRQACPPASGPQHPATWLLDSQGIVMPLESYPSLQQSGQLPKLTVLGVLEARPRRQTAKNRTLPGLAQFSTLVVSPQKRSQWPHLYRALSQTPLSVSEIDWRDEANLVLKTELGTVHLGPYGSRFANQLSTLDQMRDLPKQLDPKRVTYIDLKNPKNPLLQMNNPKPVGVKP